MKTPAPDDLIGKCAVRVRHPLECMPFRPEAQPKWSPGWRERHTRVQQRLDRAAYRSPKLVADKDLGAVRINFRYASFQSMTAAHSEKAGRDQYFEGPHETYGFRFHEIDTRYLDLQYQPARLEWFSPAGFSHRMTFDYGVETQDGRVVFGEDKPTQDYFEAQDLTERLDFAENYLNTLGASLERRIAGGLSTSLQRRIVKDIFDARRTAFDEMAVARVRSLVLSNGGTASLDRVLGSIGGNKVLALEIARAMMHRRILAMPTHSPPMPDTPVTVPPPAKKGALRAFLARYVAEGGVS